MTRTMIWYHMHNIYIYEVICIIFNNLLFYYAPYANNITQLQEQQIEGMLYTFCVYKV